MYDAQSIINDGSSVAAFDGRVTRLSPGDYTYINDSMGLHKVGNVSQTERATSLHVYAPGWKVVNTYDEVPTSVAQQDVETDASGVPLDVDGWGDF